MGACPPFTDRYLPAVINYHRENDGPTITGIAQSIAVQAWEQTFAGPGHPDRTFAQKFTDVCFVGLTRPTKTPLTAPISELPIAVATKFGRAQHPRTSITADYMGPN